MKTVLGPLLAMVAIVALGAEPRTFIPSGSVEARVMQVAASPRAQELTAKLQSAILEHREWWLEFVKSAPAGEPLPYDQRLGLTEAEHSELLQVAEDLALNEVGVVTVVFNWLSETEVVLDVKSDLPALSGIKIDLATDTASTDFGELSTRSEINNTDPDSPTGPWRGVQWKLDSVNADFKSGVVAKLAFGRLARTGEGILYFDAKEVEDGSIGRRSSAILLYALP